MSQLPEQILNQQATPFNGLYGQAIPMINPTQFPGQIQQPITQPQNMPMNNRAEDQKIKKVINNSYLYNNHLFKLFF